MKLHLGSGNNYLNGWVNIDNNNKIKADIYADLCGTLPFKDNTIDYIFNEHFIEHISRTSAVLFLSECYRILKPKGVLRISTPNLEWIIDRYNNGNLKEWENIKWYPKSKCSMINEAMRSWGHQYLYDNEELYLILNFVKFYKIENVIWRDSIHKDLKMLECRPYHNEIIIEGTK